MKSTCPMFNAIKRQETTKGQKPTCKNSFRILEVKEPYQGSMVSADLKSSLCQVMMKMFHKIHDCIEFFSCRAIVSLSFIQDFASISYYSFFSILELG